jgi:transcriptional regulator with XRE-family HTH domain
MLAQNLTLNDLTEETFGERLKKALTMEGITQAKLAEITGISANTISNMCTDKNKGLPDAINIFQISLALKTTPNFLMGFFDEIRNITEDDLLNLNESPIFQKTGLKISLVKPITNSQNNIIQKFTECLEDENPNGNNKYKALEFTCSSYYSPFRLYPPYERDYRGCPSESVEISDDYIIKDGNIHRINDLDGFDPENLHGRKIYSMYDVAQDIASSTNEIEVPCGLMRGFSKAYNYDVVGKTASSTDKIEMCRGFMEDFSKAYKRERHGLGVLGKLSTNRFFWLSMVLAKATLLD